MKDSAKTFTEADVAEAESQGYTRGYELGTKVYDQQARRFQLARDLLVAQAGRQAINAESHAMMAVSCVDLADYLLDALVAKPQEGGE